MDYEWTHIIGYNAASKEYLVSWAPSYVTKSELGRAAYNPSNWVSETVIPPHITTCIEKLRARPTGGKAAPASGGVITRGMAAKM